MTGDPLCAGGDARPVRRPAQVCGRDPALFEAGAALLQTSLGEVVAEGPIDLASALSGLTIELARNGQSVDEGVGSNVLDGPIQALKHLADLLSKDDARPPLRAGELVSTGTITRAFPIAPGERWSTVVSGFELPGLNVEFY